MSNVHLLSALGLGLYPAPHFTSNRDPELVNS